ncbi:MBL fold metallo-hydrolase [Pseudalkalibacillus hwajinpoensis]|uniref:MBL fold metallo-hydrolase n=1 Tax=Guptibacillus hwajinpoensis TaxID=208199 RepID=A0A4U1MLF6_9BACL|nr:MBL fold metallo-hydrolase [Pseudalkalibacillus hwajinpoensis]TKD71372.1 MBL fold metallo-hydrolase [Pseudalkalibacillus hwajinpoensis]
MLETLRIGEDLSLVDLYDLTLEKRTGSYILHEQELTIIETSATPSIPYLIEGLNDLNIELKSIKNIIVTHIHLDHAGGAGSFLEKCPNARVIVHPKGARHLSNPERLIQGAKAVYGSKFDQLFDPIVPIPEDRLLVMNDGDTLPIGPNRTLTFLDTPGHAKHHFSIHDSKTNGVFVGDTVGVYYPQLDFELYLPSTSPNQFDPEAMLDSAEKIFSYHPTAIYFGHYGKSNNPLEVSRQLKHWLTVFLDKTETIVDRSEEDSFDEQCDLLADELLLLVQTKLDEHDVPEDHVVYNYISVDLKVCAMGLIDYYTKTANKTS